MTPDVAKTSHVCRDKSQISVSTVFKNLKILRIFKNFES